MSIKIRIKHVFSTTVMTMVCLFAATSAKLYAQPQSHLDLPLYVEGEVTELKDLAKGRPTVLIFWAVDCQFCKEEVPAINAIHQNFQDDLLVLAINTDQDYSALKRVPAYIKQFDLQPRTIQDPRGTVAKEFSVPGTPTVVILDKQGRMRNMSHSNLETLKPALEFLIRSDS